MKKILFISLLMFVASMCNAQVRYEVRHLGDSVNTTGTETAAIVVDDSLLVYSSMESREATHLYMVDFTPLVMQLFSAHLSDDGSIGKGDLLLWGLNSSRTNTANAAYDAKHDVLYFTRSKDSHGNEYHIYYSQRKNKKWSSPKLLGGNVNVAGYSSTHPAICQQANGETVLYFSSDRPGGQGGMDLWYSVIISPGVPANCFNLGATINTDSNEVTPFYSMDDDLLYFSSNRMEGHGGYDIYSAEGGKTSWQLPLNLGDEINSPYNDLFFSQQPCRCRCVTDSIKDNEMVEACGFFSSNRPGTLFVTDSTCCNDLFRWRRIRSTSVNNERRLLNADKYQPRSALDLLPLSLYFHNDEPHPKTLDTTTTLDYTTTWNRYMPLKEEYKGAQSNPVDFHKRDSIQKDVDYFFDYELKNCNGNLIKFLEFLYQDLKAGKQVSITVNGFASPLFESQYNVNISKRRIDCVRNQLKRWNDEALLPFLNNGRLKVVPAAFGAPSEEDVVAGDPLRNPNNVKSVYSMDAAHARRIDIIDYQIIK